MHNNGFFVGNASKFKYSIKKLSQVCIKHYENVLITGGAGYIGSLLSDTLVTLNYNVTVVDNMYFKKYYWASNNKKNFKFIKDDARNKDLILKLLRENDIIIPLACLVGAPLCDKFPLEAKEVNQDSIINIIKSKSKEQIILYPNTNSGYGTTDKNVECDENMPLNPISVYGKTKCVFNELMQNENVTSFRLATVFDPHFVIERSACKFFLYNALFEKTNLLSQN